MESGLAGRADFWSDRVGFLFRHSRLQALEREDEEGLRDRVPATRLGPHESHRPQRQLEGLVDAEPLERGLRPELAIAADEKLPHLLRRDRLLPVLGRRWNEVRAVLAEVIARLGDGEVVEVEQRELVVVVNELVVLEIAMGRQPCFLVGLADAVAHVRDEVLHQEVAARKHVCELLGDAVESRELALYVDPLVRVEARFMDHCQRLRRGMRGHAELGARPVAADCPAAYALFKKKADVLHETEWSREIEVTLRVSRGCLPESFDDAEGAQPAPARLNLAVDDGGKAGYVDGVLQDRSDLGHVTDSVDVDLAGGAENVR